MMILIMAAYYAINKSNNKLSKLLGVYIACRWVLYFIEDIALFDLNNFFLWLSIGLCYSNSFRALSDKELRDFFRMSAHRY